MEYRTFAESILGVKYEEKEWPCQDSSCKQKIINFVAVADGHGGSNYFRSEIGSKTAIYVALTRMMARTAINNIVCSGEDDKDNASLCFNESNIADLKYAIVTDWRKSVKSHWDKKKQETDGVYDDEIRYESVSNKYKDRYTSCDESVVEQYLYKAYGTTLIVALAIKEQILFLQVGDGTCVVLQRDGEFRIPIPPDENSKLNITSSLCDDDVFPKSFRHAVMDREPDKPTEPVAVFLSTDGVDDCYPILDQEQYLFKLYTVIIENILNHGFEATENELTTDLLPDMMAKGSQDDISLAFLICDDMNVLREAFENIDVSHKQ